MTQDTRVESAHDEESDSPRMRPPDPAGASGAGRGHLRQVAQAIPPLPATPTAAPTPEMGELGAGPLNIGNASVNLPLALKRGPVRGGLAMQLPGISDSSHQFDLEMMGICLELARNAAIAGEVPVGALVARDGLVLARGSNRTVQDCDPTAHAERLALTAAGQARGSWRLDGCVLYVTLEPCVMCAGAIVLSRIDRLVYGTPDPKAGACRSLYRVTEDLRLNHRLRVTSGVLQGACSELLTRFFRSCRNSDPLPEGCLSG